MAFIIIKELPFYDDWSGQTHISISNIAVITDCESEVEALCLVQEANDTILRFIKIRDERVHEIEKLEYSPPYEEMIAAIGSKPKYDHSLEGDQVYNDLHKDRIKEWKKKFQIWTKENKDQWEQRKEELVDQLLGTAKLENMNPLFEISEDEISERLGRYGRSHDRLYYYPNFKVEFIPLLSKKSFL